MEVETLIMLTGFIIVCSTLRWLLDKVDGLEDQLKYQRGLIRGLMKREGLKK